MKVRKIKRWRFTYGKGRRTRSLAIKRAARTLKRSQANKPEVKYCDISNYDNPLPIQYPTGATTTLYAPQFLASNLLASITQGYARQERIGGKIYVKFIRIHAWVRACPSATQYDVGDFQLRLIFSNTGNSRFGAGNSIAGYFSSPARINLYSFIDRSEIYVHSDKFFRIHGGSDSTQAVDPFANTGAFRFISYTIPIGRTVDYVGDTDVVKDNKDYICLSALIACPGMSSPTNGRQIGCLDYNIRVYYTDV